MFWADKVVGDIEERFAQKIAKGEVLVIRDEKTASGRVHVGSMRGVAIHGLLSEMLTARNIANHFLYEINDVDPMDDIPSYLDASKYEPYLWKPLYTIPAPEPTAKNFAEFYGEEFKQVIEGAGFTPEFYRASELYRSGRMDDIIALALEKRDLIREIYKRVSGSQKGPDWFPISPAVSIGITGKPIPIVAYEKSTDGDRQKDMVTWRNPDTGEEGHMSPYGGNCKFTWKVDWAAKFVVQKVDIEGGGKDHSTKGGARDVANTIAREVFASEPPFDVPYEFFLVGGKKMSSSKGKGSSARDIAELLPRHIFRLALLGKDIKQQINFDPAGDSIPLLFDWYDRLAEKKWSSVDDDDTKLFEYIHGKEDAKLLEQRFLPRFSMIAFLVQMLHLPMERELEKLKGSPLTDQERQESEMRANYARVWLNTYAPENYRFVLQTEKVPEGTKDFSATQRAALKALHDFIESEKELDGAKLHEKLHQIKEEVGIEPKALFSALYISFLGKESGPKAGWFLSVLERKFLLKRLGEVSI